MLTPVTCARVDVKTMNKLSSLTIFFPAFNEESNIAESVKVATEVASRVTENSDFEIVVVNDGSSDSTAAVVEELQKTNPNLKLINHPNNQGYGGALMTGFCNATKEWVFFTDADLQFDLNEIENLIQKTDDSDVVIGYRIKRNDPLMRLLNAKGWNLLNRLFFGLRVKDIDCAFKLIKKSAVDRILSSTQSRGAMISAELLIRLKRVGYTFAEVGVNHYPRTQGEPTGAKPSVIIRAFKEMATVYRGELGSQWVKQVIKFLIVGVTNTIVDLATYFFVSRYIPFFKTRKIWAKAVGYVLGVTNSFIWNRSWTFKSEVAVFSGLVRFVLVSIASLGINTGLMFVALTFFNLSEIYSLVIATVGTLSWNFLASKYLIFRS